MKKFLFSIAKKEKSINMTFLILFLSLFVILGMMGFIYFTFLESQKKTSITASPSSSFVQKEELRGDISFYIDFSCPHCKKYWEETIFPLQQKYSQEKNISFHLFFYPLLSEGISTELPNFAMCAEEQTDIWTIISALYALPQLSIEKIPQISKTLNLDEDILNNCLIQGEKRKILLENRKKYTEKGVKGTPTTFINGVKKEGIIPIENLDLIITKILDSFVK